MGTFSDYAPKYRENGWIVTPVKGQRPFLEQWNDPLIYNYSDEQFEKLCDQYGNCEVGLIMANGVVGLDCDSFDRQIVDAARAMLPIPELAKFGSKGFTYFYKCNEIPDFQKIEPFGEILCNGKMTVVPPSLHPKIDKPYVWTIGDAVDVSPSDLTEITLDFVDEFRSFMSKRFGVAENSVGTGGRNNTLKSYCARLIAENKTLPSIIELLIDESRKIAKNDGKVPLFMDNHEFRGSDDENLNAANFALSIFKSVNRARKTRGIPQVKLTISPDDLKTNGIENEIIQKGFYEEIVKKNGQVTYKPLFLELADYVIDKENAYTDNGEVYFFDSKKYYYVDPDVLGKKIINLTNRRAKTKHERSEFYSSIKTQGADNKKALIDAMGFINMNNGVFNTLTGELEPHSPKYNFQYCLDFDYDADAECPQFMKSLDTVMCGDEELKLLFQQYLAYTFIGGKPWLTKVLCLHGDGSNGKSTMLRLIKELLGPENVSSVPIVDLNKPFSAVGTLGKLANINEDLSKAVIDSGQFKAASDGGMVRMSYKNVDEFEAPFTARLIFATNHIPNFNDASTGMKRRLLFIPFDAELDGGDDYIDGITLDEMLKAERSGIFNWVAQLLPIDPRTFNFVKARKSVELFKTWEREADSVSAWSEENLKIGFEYDGETSEDLHRDYANWCLRNGRKYKTKDGFIKTLKRNTRLHLNLTNSYELSINPSRNKGRGLMHCKISHNVRF